MRRDEIAGGATDGVAENGGKVALQRGPIVYNAEGVDTGGGALELALPLTAFLE